MREIWYRWIEFAFPIKKRKLKPNKIVIYDNTIVIYDCFNFYFWQKMLSYIELLLHSLHTNNLFRIGVCVNWMTLAEIIDFKTLTLHIFFMYNFRCIFACMVALCYTLCSFYDRTNKGDVSLYSNFTSIICKNINHLSSVYICVQE